MFVCLRTNSLRALKASFVRGMGEYLSQNVMTIHHISKYMLSVLCCTHTVSVKV